MSVRRLFAFEKPVAAATPVFVLGIQKAGTSAIAALLSKATGGSLTSDFMHSEKKLDYRVALFKREIPFEQFVRRNKRAFSRDIIKDPNLSFFYEELRAYFPRARFVFVGRDPRQNIRSTLNWMKLPGNLSSPTSELSRHAYKFASWKLMIEGRFPSVRGDNYIARLAERWNLASETYLRNRDRIALIRYEDFVKDKIQAISRLAREVGLKAARDIQADVDIPYQPPGASGVKLQEFFGPANLQIIETICGERMRQLSYAAG